MPFKKSFKKAIIWASSILFIVLIAIGYLLYTLKPTENHLNLIPNSTNGLLIINPYEIVNELKRKPSLISKLDITQFLTADGSYGIHPLSKIVIFQDSLYGSSVVGAVVSLIDQHDFVSFIFKNDVQPIVVNETEIFIENNFATALYKDAAIVLYSQNLNIDQQQFLDYFQKAIIGSESNNLTIPKSNDHFTLWNKKIDHPLVNFCSIKAHTTTINLTDSGFNFNSCVELKDTFAFNSLKLNPIELGSDEIGKLSFSLSKSKTTKLLSFSPFNLDSTKKYFKEKMWISAIGYRKNSVLFRDSIVLNENFSIPELAIGIEISDTVGIRNSLNYDSCCIQKQNYFEVSSTDFQKEKFYLYILEDQLLLSTKPVETANLALDFHTLSMKVDLEKAIKSYTVKKISQQFMVNSVKSFNPQKINFYSYEKTDNKLLIKGTINFGDENEHIFETLLPAFELLSNNLTL
tara:strand:- start:3322 stop:4707 length:1386 start_codon:yes stop_codon:yes gene_type:complete